MTKKTQIIISFAIGCIFISVLLVLAMVFPHPTDFQYTVFRIVLALAAAGLAAMLPGFIEVAWSGVVRAGGAFGIFVVVYFFSPAAIVTSPPGGKPIQAQATQQPSQKDVASNEQVGTSSAPIQKKPPLPKEVEKKDVGEGKKPATSEPRRDYVQHERKAEPPIRNRDEAKQIGNGGLIWQKDIDTKAVTWAKAQEYCKSLGLGGYNNWRLPTISELKSLVDKRYSPPVNPLFGTLPDSAIYPPHFWSSTLGSNDNNEALFLNFKNGLAAQINKEKGYGFARCVRHE